MANDKRLIDKDALIELCDSPHWCVWMNEIEDFPTVDAVEVAHGRWIEKPNPWGQDGSHSYDCSICGKRTCVVGEKLRYCPNCGAKMDLEEIKNGKARS